MCTSMYQTHGLMCEKYLTLPATSPHCNIFVLNLHRKKSIAG
jgi:hypothetical protein